MNNTVYNSADTNNIIEKLETNITISQVIKIINNLYNQGDEGEEKLLNFLINRIIIQKKKIIIADGIIFKSLYKTKNKNIAQKLQQYFKNGIIHLKQDSKINYQHLQNLLIENKFQEADKITQQYLCNLAGLDSTNKRQWLYFTDIPLIPSEDLLIIDLLWKIYSQGKFGFSVQRKIWLTNSCKWTTLWKQIGWTNKGIPCRYPEEFIWTLDAPSGHLPLFNQLRGIQVLSSLFEHIAWQQMNDI